MKYTIASILLTAQMFLVLVISAVPLAPATYTNNRMLLVLFAILIAQTTASILLVWMWAKEPVRLGEKG